MSKLLSFIGIMMISIGLCEMGYGINTIVWWLIIAGVAIYATGWRLR